MNWPGIEISLNRDNNKILAYSADARETEQNPINSASGTYDISEVIDLYDGKWHNILYMWSMDDTETFFNLGQEATSALRRGVLIVDGYIIPIDTTWPGKMTPHSFIHNFNNKLATFINFGGNTYDAGSSAYDSGILVNNTFAGLMRRVAIWDKILGPDESTNLIPIERPEKPNGRQSFIEHSQWIGKDAETGLDLSSAYDPLTGSWFKGLSSNLIGYWKFDELNLNSTFATDYAGKLNASSPGTSGAQINPTYGNPINWYNAKVNEGDYKFQDIPNPDQDGVMRTGFIVFEDETGNQRKIGFINYDLGTIIIDGEYLSEKGLTGSIAFISNLGISGLTFSSSLSAFGYYWIKSMNFVKQKYVERLIANVGASGDEMNLTENKTGIDQTTGYQILNPNATYVTSVGLYNDMNELIAIAKLNKCVRKDEEHNVITQIKIDF